MDPNQNKPSSSTPEGIVPIVQLEQLLRLLQPNFDLSQALAALVPPPQATTTTISVQNPAIPPTSEAAPASPPVMTEILEEGAAEANLADDTKSVPSKEVEDRHKNDDAKWVEMVKSRMAREDVERPTDAGRIEEVMAEIEAEIREGRTPTIENVGVVETGLEEGNREEVGEVVVDISESENEDRVR